LLSEVVSLPAHVVEDRPEVAAPMFEQGSVRVCLHESRVPTGYGSFPGTVPRIVVVCKGWVNPMELTRFAA
jgi:hypothetical protein